MLLKFSVWATLAVEFIINLINPMKKILLAFAAALTFTAAEAQMADGSVCPDFTGTDINGNEWNLYDLLDQGYSVVVDVSATWCGPCWNYHNSGALETLYEEHGPDGTNELRVLFIEGDATTTAADLNGTGTSTQGDWVTNTPYPIIDDGSIADLLQIGYFPTIYTICPSRIITETGQMSAANHYAWIQDNACQAATAAVDAAALGMTADGATCTNGTVTAIVELQNMGTSPLTAATITITGGTAPVVFNWTGNLATYASTNVSIPNVGTNGSTTLTATVAVNGDANSANSIATAQAGVAQATTHIRIDILFDGWPEEVAWEITDDNGNVVASKAAGDYANATETMEDYFLPATGCYTFTYTDGYGDGLHGAQYTGGWDGHMYVYSIGTGGVVNQAIYDYDGSYNLGATPQVAASESKDFSVTATVGINENSLTTGFNVYPNPVSETLNLNFGLSQDAVVTVEVVDMLGNIVMSEQIGSKQAGMNNAQLNMSELAAGMYMVNLKANNAVSTLRVSVSK
ncbi:MAG: hypothetical protein RLZZ262_1611 [Bacteroidota bacterium]|jgi:flagellar hook assembly protein FlgD